MLTAGCSRRRTPPLPSSDPRLLRGDARAAAPECGKAVQEDRLLLQRSTCSLACWQILGAFWFGGNICFAAAVRGTLPAGCSSRALARAGTPRAGNLLPEAGELKCIHCDLPAVLPKKAAEIC